MPRIDVRVNVVDADVVNTNTIKSNNIPKNSFILFVLVCS
jgi:hypothetical protein